MACIDRLRWSESDTPTTRSYPDKRVGAPESPNDFDGSMVPLTTLEDSTHTFKMAPPPSFGSRIRCVGGMSISEFEDDAMMMCVL